MRATSISRRSTTTSTNTIGDWHPPSTGYFHSYWHRGRPTQPRRDYEIRPRVAGRGRYLGASVGVIADRARWLGTWWGEGEVEEALDHWSSCSYFYLDRPENGLTALAPVAERIAEM